VIVSIHGEIDFADWARIDAVLWDLIDDQGNLDVVVDLSEVVYLERDAVSLIVHAARQAHCHGGRLRLADRACRDRWRGSSQ
jgi:anti-anti-sigma factor